MHIRTRSFILIAALGFFLVAIEYVAVRYSLYWRFWWFDIPMHLLGGACIGMFIFWLMRFEIVSAPRHVSLPLVLILVFALGGAWEIFEVLVGVPVSPFMSHTADTIKDVCMDLLGGAAGYLVLKRLMHEPR